MAIDYARLKSVLANSKIQAENNALYQSILGLIQAAQEYSGITDAAIASIQSALASNSRGIFVVEANTSTAPVTYDLAEYVTATRGFVIFKDLSGNANANNITLTGTVEGVVDPVINVDFDFYKVYLGSDGDFHTW